jgi:hypothetical protein
MDYRLDLGTLLMMLKQRSGSLYTEAPHIPGIKGPCQVFLRLELGEIKSCLIRNEQGLEKNAEASLIRLIRDQVLEWHFNEERPVTRPLRPSYLSGNLPALRSPETPPRLSMPLPPLSPVPYRLRNVSREEFLTWMRPYRTIYSLIDGRSSVDDIVRLLAREQGREQILEMLRNLYRENLIGFESNGQRINMF